ncbi:hypothetical protein MYX84_14990 [Acidobacteria bacterium AH-259-O06]|nr:hypothetical protein [Acidobacteria bacterium AH-259-O06]
MIKKKKATFKKTAVKTSHRAAEYRMQGAKLASGDPIITTGVRVTVSKYGEVLRRLTDE